MSSPQQPAPPIAVGTWPVALRDVIVVVVLATVGALSTNALRSTGDIPLVAEREYEILVPCPEFEGEAEALEPDAVPVGQQGVLVVDAREPEDHKAWHLPGAASIPYDFLEPTNPALLKKILSSSPRKVVVYGDGDDPDTGEQLARELSGKGIRNVAYVKGGAPALRKVSGGGR